MKNKNDFAQLFYNLFIFAVQENVPHEFVSQSLGIFNSDYFHDWHQAFYLDSVFLIVLEYQEFLENLKLF